MDQHYYIDHREGCAALRDTRLDPEDKAIIGPYAPGVIQFFLKSLTPMGTLEISKEHLDELESNLEKLNAGDKRTLAWAMDKLEYHTRERASHEKWVRRQKYNEAIKAWKQDTYLKASKAMRVRGFMPASNPSFDGRLHASIPPGTCTQTKYPDQTVYFGMQDGDDKGWAIEPIPFYGVDLYGLEDKGIRFLEFLEPRLEKLKSLFERLEEIRVEAMASRPEAPPDWNR